jgi:hypothetical protein
MESACGVCGECPENEERREREREKTMQGEEKGREPAAPSSILR